MPRSFTVKLTEEESANLKAEVRKEMEYDFNYEKLMEYLSTTHSIGFQEYICKYGLIDRVEKINNMKVGDLTDHQKMLLACYWLMKGLGFR